MGMSLFLNVTNATSEPNSGDPDSVKNFYTENVEFEAKNNFPLFWRLMFRDDESRLDVNGYTWLLTTRAETIARLDEARPISGDRFVNDLLDAFIDLLSVCPGANVILRGDILQEWSSDERLAPSFDDVARTVARFHDISTAANASTTEVNARLLTGEMCGGHSEQAGLVWPPPALVRRTPRPPQRPTRPQRPGETRPLPEWRSPAKAPDRPFPVGVIFGLEIGDRVEHRDFGVGVVLSSEGAGGDEKIRVAFGSDEPTELLLSWAPLRRA